MRDGTEPFFLDTPAGSRFALAFRPTNVPVSRIALLVPPFAEEMNKSRRAFAELGRRAAAAGCLSLLPDLYGTGDSPGDFGEATWSAWLDDLTAAAAWLRQHCAGEPAVLAARAGALLATDWLRSGAGAANSVTFWHPVLAGEQWLKQFLRTRVVAERFEGRETTIAALRATLSAQGSLEVAGYTLGASMADSLDRARLDAWTPTAATAVHWLEVGGGERVQATGAAAGVVERWRAGGASVTWREIPAEQFWATPEITLPLALVDATLPLLVPVP